MKKENIALFRLTHEVDKIVYLDLLGYRVVVRIWLDIQMGSLGNVKMVRPGRA